jgi:hypothetical protein
MAVSRRAVTQSSRKANGTQPRATGHTASRGRTTSARRVRRLTTRSR